MIHRQLFEVVIQASCQNKIICRERIPPLRKNVTAKCYGSNLFVFLHSFTHSFYSKGGDISRKRKLLEKQKEGKKKMRQIGTVELSQEAFYKILRD